jgi:hypothetical protein
MREKQTPDEESTIDLEPTIEMAAAADGDPATSVEEPAIVEPTSVQESTFDDETEATVSQQTSDAQPSVDDQPTVTVEAVDSDEASTEELILSQELADLTDRADRSIEPGADHDDEFDWNWDWPKDVDSQHDLNIAATDSDEQAERPTEPHQMPYVSPSDTTDEWALYPDAHPTSAKGSESGSPAEPIVEADIHDGSARPAASGRLPNGQGRNQPRRKTRRRSGSRK